MARVLKKAWHEVFAECIEPYTDAPKSYLTWGAISFISAALKNNVFLNIGTYTLYPNMFIVLVGPPGVGKGTVMNIIEDMNNENKLNKIVNTLSDRITTEKIIETIETGWQQAPKIIGNQMAIAKAEHSCLIFSTELRTLLGGSNWMLEFLEEAWSKTKFDYQTKNKGSAFMENSCCSLISGSVPDILRNINKESQLVITGGFSSRCLFIYAEGVDKDNPFPPALKQNKKSKMLWDDLITDLKQIGSLNGEFQIAVDAKILLSKYLTENKIAIDSAESEAEANFRARIKSHVIKLAIAFSVSKGDTMVLDIFDIMNAMSEINKVVECIKKLFRGAGDSVDASSTARVQNFIEKKGMATKREILTALVRHITMSDLERILWVLESIGFCTSQERNKQTFYIHTPALMKKARVGP